MNNNIIEENSADRIDSLKFEDLNTKDQLSKLESVYGELSKKFLEEYNDDVIRGNYLYLMFLLPELLIIDLFLFYRLLVEMEKNLQNIMIMN